jgi:PAS domain S-box-containing protein
LQAIAERELPDHASEIARALARVLDVELGLMCGTYLDAHAERIHRFEQDAKGRMYQAMEKNERRYVRAVDLAKAIIVGLDREGTILLFNPEAERVSGYAADEACGMHFADDLLAGDEDCPFDAAFAQVMRGDDGKSTAHATCRLRTRSDHMRDAELHLVRTPDDDDDVVVYVHGEDVTGRTEMEARLRQSERLAVVGTLAAGLAHEIRNPLNGAQLHLTFLRRGLARLEADDLQEWMDAVGVVASEITRLSDLVSDFLDFARPRRLKPETVSLNQLGARSIDMLRADAEAHDAQLELKLPRSELEAFVDAAMLEQVLLNLLRNAIDAVADTGGGRVELRLKRTPGHAVIEVVDDGPGLSDPNGPIFDAFYTTKSTGTGLGLAIVHRIIADHGGIIAVTSRPGETVFRVRLPLASRPVVNSELPPPSVTVYKAGTS